MLICVCADPDGHSNDGILLAARNTLFYAIAVQLFAFEICEEETRYFGYGLLQFHLPNYGCRHSALPHEQRQILEGARFCTQRLLQPHGPVAQDTKKGRSGLPRRHLHTVSSIHQTFQPVSNHLKNRLLGPDLHLHGAQVRHKM